MPTQCYGHGSSTLANWIRKNLDQDQATSTPPRQPEGDGSVLVSGDLKQWHKITLTRDGPFAHERDTNPNPFTDYRMTVTLRHASGTPEYVVPGYFAADGNAAESSADSGTKWRAHLSPDKPGRWEYRVAFAHGPRVALSDVPGEVLAPFDGQNGAFEIASTTPNSKLQAALKCK